MNPVVEYELAQLILYVFLGVSTAVLILIGLVLILVGVILYQVFKGPRDFADPTLLAKNAASGAAAIQRMLAEYVESKDPRLCKVINDAINNWNANFSPQFGTMNTINCP